MRDGEAHTHRGELMSYTTDRKWLCRHSGVIITASVILMNSSFLSMASRAPRTLSATSADPCCSTQFESSMMAASRAS